MSTLLRVVLVCGISSYVFGTLDMGSYYDQLITNTMYAIQDMELTFNVLMLEEPVHGIQKDYTQITSMLGQAIGRFVIVTMLLKKGILDEPMKNDNHFWLYILNQLNELTHTLTLHSKKHCIFNLVLKHFNRCQSELVATLQRITNEEMQVQIQ